MKKEDLEKHIKEWTEENTPVGKMLGYPDCCIKEFCDQPPALLKSLKRASDSDVLRYKAGCINGEFSGLIPCTAHARLIMSKSITLESLIKKSRATNIPLFPQAFKY
jgi:hypothetical protein